MLPDPEELAAAMKKVEELSDVNLKLKDKIAEIMVRLTFDLACGC